MNCHEYEARLRDYLERASTPEEARAVEEHVHACARCADLHRRALEITCREVAELYDYIEGTLPPERRAAFQRHFAICGECRDYLASYEATVRVSKETLRSPSSDATALPEDVVRSILRRGRDARR